MNRILISAAHKSSGKTTISLGLCAALRNRDLTVQPFKKGPDYIDPMWLKLASQRDCHNLDFYVMGKDEILRTFVSHASNADISIIEGNKGLYDGLDLDGSNSNAALASLLETPVVLVIDARGMTRGIAPLILGYQAFDKTIHIAGVILNRLGGSRHEAKLRAVIEHYTDVPVLGAVHYDERLIIGERHLGLTPSNETNEATDRIQTIAMAITEHVDLDRVNNIAATATPMVETIKTVFPPTKIPTPDIRIGLAQDAAFGFYYPEDLEALQAAGAEIIHFNTLTDSQLPNVDALFIGGGFPECHMEALQNNAVLRADIRSAIDAGMPVYAECGGLMYLSRSLKWKDQVCNMVGAIPADTIMYDKPQGRGYTLLRENKNGLWPISKGVNKHAEIRAHEFHYSTLVNVDPDVSFAYEVLRGYGIDGKRDGIVHKNVSACYAHMRNLENNRWAERFVDFIRQHKKKNQLKAVR